MYIDKSLQSKGVGTKLLNIYIDSVPKGNKIWVDTKKENKPAIDFYKKNNFTKKHSLLLSNLMLVRKKI